MNWTDVRDEILGLVFQRTGIQVSKLSLASNRGRAAKVLLFLATTIALQVSAVAQPDASQALWLAVKRQLTGPAGDEYFTTHLRGASQPAFRGTLITADATESTTGFDLERMILSMTDAITPEVTLVIHNQGRLALHSKPTPGAVIAFTGVPVAFTREPFMLTFDVHLLEMRGLDLGGLDFMALRFAYYQRELDSRPGQSLAHYRLAELFFAQNNYQAAANEFREALLGELQPKWIEAWSHVSLGQIFDATGQRERAINEYRQAMRTEDNIHGALDQAAMFLQTPYKRVVAR